MFTTREAPRATIHRRAIYRSLGYDFALLGLPAGEARVEVIRDAASQTAARIQQAAGDDRQETIWMLSDLASSTYRLLDPRRRTKMVERVKLCLYSETDLELQKDARRPLFSQPTAGPSPLVVRNRLDPLRPASSNSARISPRDANTGRDLRPAG